MLEKVKSIAKDIRLSINRFGSKKRSEKLLVKNPTIISNNCYAGIVSQYLGIQYNTPTVGLYFFADEYIKFLKDFNHYIKQELKFIPTAKSKYYRELCKKNENNSLVGQLDDVEIVFLHYKSKEEARDKWNRRVKRINPKNIIIKFSEQNLCNKEHIEQFMKLPFDKKICFVAHNYNIKGTIEVKSDFKNGENISDYYKTHKYLNIIKYLNEK